MDRLAIVGKNGMGAITYEPEIKNDSISGDKLDFDQPALECQNIIKTGYDDDLDRLFQLGGSSGGARPKILTTIEGEEWIIKFPSSYNIRDVGSMEYEYSLCAKACGIEMEETRLFSSKLCSGYFGTKRFDRIGSGRRWHMVSVSGLLETSHRIPNLDYDTLFRLTLDLTKNFNEIKKLYRRMCFNIIAHNRDDHSKNFSYIYVPDKGWELAPAYDLTFSHSIGGEHATSVNGKGRNPSIEDAITLGGRYGINKNGAKKIWEDIEVRVNEMLTEYITQ